MTNPVKKMSRLKKVIIAIVDCLILHLSIIFAFYVKFGSQIPSYNFDSYKQVYIYITVVFLLLNLLSGIYIFYNKTIEDMLVITIISQSIFMICMMAITFFARGLTLPRSVLIISFVSSIVFLSLWRVFVFSVYVKAEGSKKIVLVGTKKDISEAYSNISQAKSSRHVVSNIIIDHFSKNMENVIENIDIIYIASNIDCKSKIIDLAIKYEKKIFLKAEFPTILMLKPNVMNIDDESLIEISDFSIPTEYAFIKRLFDILVAGCLLILVSPILLITAILIKLTSKGPVFYSQVRITKGQKEFKILKFRTMVQTAETSTGPVLATANDSRVTGLGKYLRAFRIDELPQLINVLFGSMSMVGPRPERPFFVDQFKTENPHYFLRHNVRAGITGYAQVYGKYATNFNNKLKFDLVYIKNYSLILDAKILFQTIKILFDKVSSSGVDDELEEMTLKQIEEQVEILD